MTMKKLNFLSLLFIAITIVSCRNTTTKNTTTNVVPSNEEIQKAGETNNEMLRLTTMELTDKKWLEIKSGYDKLMKAQNEIMDGEYYEGSLYINLSGIATPDDVSLGGMIVYYKLKEQDYRFLPDNEYAERIKYVFGIDLNAPDALDKNKLKNHEDYIVALNPSPDMDSKGNIQDKEFYPYRNHLYFFKKFNICVVQMPSALLLEIDKNTDKDHINVYKNPFDYHWNNYVLNDNKASLTWLLSNGKEMEVKDLLFCFGYDKDAKLNKLILDSISNNANDGYSVESLEQAFAGRDLNGKLQIHENLLKFIQENPTNDYVKMLDIYGNYCLGERTGRKFTRDESFKIAAYITYYLKLIDLENHKRSGSDKYLIINDMLFRTIGALEDEEGNQRDDEGGDSKFLKEIIKNDYYNLPNFKEMVHGLVNDYRNIGYSSEEAD